MSIGCPPRVNALDSKNCEFEDFLDLPWPSATLFRKDAPQLHKQSNVSMLECCLGLNFSYHLIFDDTANRMSFELKFLFTRHLILKPAKTSKTFRDRNKSVNSHHNDLHGLVKTCVCCPFREQNNGGISMSRRGIELKIDICTRMRSRCIHWVKRFFEYFEG